MQTPNIVFTAPCVAEVLDRPVPSPGPGEVLVRKVLTYLLVLIPPCFVLGVQRG